MFPLLLTAQPDPAYDAYQRWEQQHRTGDYRVLGQALYEASTEWTAKWPDSRLAWEQRRNSLLQVQNRSPALWKEVDENLIRLSVAHTYALFAAQDWVTYGINLKEAKALLSSEIAWLNTHPRPATAGAATLTDPIEEADFSARFIRSALDFSQRRNSVEGIRCCPRADLQRIHSWLEGDFKHYYDQDPLETFPDYRSTYLTLSAQLAAAEGRKARRLGVLPSRDHRSILHRRYTRIYLKQTRALWDEMGGTPEGWTVFSEVPPLPSGVPAGYFGTSFLPWHALNYKLPPLEGAHFEGKTTLVYLWAPSCVPCWQTLPAIQKLYNTVKNQDNLQVVTINVDDDKEKLAAFVKERGYDIPVVTAPAYVEKVLPDMTIGQIWIVDPSGAVRLQRTGNPYNGREQALVDEAIYKMSQLSRVACGAHAP